MIGVLPPRIYPPSLGLFSHYGSGVEHMALFGFPPHQQVEQGLDLLYHLRKCERLPLGLTIVSAITRCLFLLGFRLGVLVLRTDS